MSQTMREALERARSALPEFTQQDDYLLAHGASLMSSDSHEILHVDTLEKIVRSVLSAPSSEQAQQGVDGIFSPFNACMFRDECRARNSRPAATATAGGVTDARDDLFSQMRAYVNLIKGAAMQGPSFFTEGRCGDMFNECVRLNRAYLDLPATAPDGGVTDEQILSCIDGREPVRLHHGAAIFEYRLFALVDFARRVLALTTAARAAEPAGEVTAEEWTKRMHAKAVEGLDTLYELAKKTDEKAAIGAAHRANAGLSGLSDRIALQAARAAAPTPETVKDLMLRTTFADRPGANLWESTSIEEKAIVLKMLRAYAASPTPPTTKDGGE